MDERGAIAMAWEKRGRAAESGRWGAMTQHHGGWKAWE